jgi:hypothetical protein
MSPGVTASGGQFAPAPSLSVPPGQNPLAHLLHALNQPLTGLQCSLELAAIGTRTPEQYANTLQEGLELTARMRFLVEALRELADSDSQQPETLEVLLLDSLIRETADDLRPVAETKQARIMLDGNVSLPVRGSPQRLSSLVFRCLESALSLAEAGTTVQLAMRREYQRAFITLRWREGAQPPPHSPFSRPELGLLVASAGWKRAGGEWVNAWTESFHTVSIWLPLTTHPNPVHNR